MSPVRMALSVAPAETATVRDKGSKQVTLLFYLASSTRAAAGRCLPLPAMVGESFSLC